MTRKPSLTLAALFLASAATLAVAQGAYPNPPTALTNRIDKLIKAVPVNATRDGNPLIPFQGGWPDLVAMTVVDYLEKPALLSTKTLKKSYEAQTVTPRTDKQTGASAGSSGSTSVVSKAGIPELLSLAVERGAITQMNNGTSLTLSTSLYALETFAGGTESDTPEAYDRSAFLRRFGLSTTFNLADVPDGTLANVKAKNISEYSTRFRIWGDRDPRSKVLYESWYTKVLPLLQQRVNAVSLLDSAVVNLRSFEVHDNSGADFGDQLNTLITEYCKARSSCKGVASADGGIALSGADASGLKELVLTFLKQRVYDRLDKREIAIPADAQDTILATHRVQLQVEARLAAAQTAFQTEADDFAKKPQLTFEFTNHRSEMPVQRYTEYKLLFGCGKCALPGTVNLEGGASAYLHPPATSTLREFHVAGSWELSSAPPAFLKNLLKDADKSKATYSISGRYTRMPELLPPMSKDIVIVQGKVEFPISSGVTFPISGTYTNHTELNKEKEIRGNFGFSFDLDKLLALVAK